MNFKHADYWLFAVLLITVTPLAFLLMPVIVAAIVVWAFVMIMITWRDQFGKSSH